jgi:hypothetical protein
LIQSTEILAGFITILVLDFKGDFRNLAEELGSDLWDSYSLGEGIRLGWGPPENCYTPLAWINQLTKVIAAHCKMQFSETTFATALRIAFDLLNDPPKHPFKFLSPKALEQFIKKLPTKMIAQKNIYKETLLQMLGYLIRNSGQLFDCEDGFDVYKHLIKPRRCAVIDCTTTNPICAQIVANLLALQVFFPRLINRQTFKCTNFVLFIDESDSLVSKEAGIIYPEGYNVIGQLLKQGREFGIMVCLGMTALGRCSEFISSNASYHVILNQNDPASVSQAAYTLLESESRQLISSLDCGVCLYKESMGPVAYPMLVEIDYDE